VSSLERFLETRGFIIEHTTLLPMSFYNLVIKRRLTRIGQHFSFGSVDEAKKRERAAHPTKGRPSSCVRLLHKVAQLKDIVVFGIPASILLLGLRFTNRRYTDFMVIARRFPAPNEPARLA